MDVETTLQVAGDTLSDDRRMFGRHQFNSFTKYMTEADMRQLVCCAGVKRGRNSRKPERTVRVILHTEYTRALSCENFSLP